IGTNTTTLYSWFAVAIYEQIGSEPWHEYMPQIGASLAPLDLAPANTLSRLGSPQPVQGRNYSVYAWIYDPCSGRFQTNNKLVVNYHGCPQSTWLFVDGVQVDFGQQWYC